MPVILTIAGFDPSSGAGVTADLRTAADHGCYGVACITALTVQSSAGVGRVVPVEPGVVAETLAELAADVRLGAVKIGMLGSAAVAAEVNRFLQRAEPPNVVLDPVLKATSGADLGPGAPALLELLPLVSVVTPNTGEATALCGLPVRNPAEARAAAARLQVLGAAAAVVTGGHFAEPTDVLSHRGGIREFPGRKFDYPVHGTGCAFSTALACELASGSEIEAAVQAAKEYVARRIETAKAIGRGARVL